MHGGDELDVGLIQQHRVRRHPPQEPLHVGGGLQGAGRIVWPA
jgi:hypothetical protein